MSEKKAAATREEMASVNSTDVIGFLNEKSTHNNCPCCGQNSWEIVGPDTDFLYGLLGTSKAGATSPAPPVLPLFGLACNNCGYLRLHALAAVAIWKRGRRE